MRLGDDTDASMTELTQIGGDQLACVAEVKTGRLAPRIDTPATRRQLLEYRLAFDVDG